MVKALGITGVQVQPRRKQSIEVSEKSSLNSDNSSEESSESLSSSQDDEVRDADSDTHQRPQLQRQPIDHYLEKFLDIDEPVVQSKQEED